MAPLTSQTRSWSRFSCKVVRIVGLTNRCLPLLASYAASLTNSAENGTMMALFVRPKSVLSSGIMLFILLSANSSLNSGSILIKPPYCGFTPITASLTSVLTVPILIGSCSSDTIAIRAPTSLAISGPSPNFLVTTSLGNTLQKSLSNKCMLLKGGLAIGPGANERHELVLIAVTGNTVPEYPL